MKLWLHLRTQIVLFAKFKREFFRSISFINNHSFLSTRCDIHIDIENYLGGSNSFIVWFLKFNYHLLHLFFLWWLLFYIISRKPFRLYFLNLPSFFMGLLNSFNCWSTRILVFLSNLIRRYFEVWSWFWISDLSSCLALPRLVSIWSSYHWSLRNKGLVLLSLQIAVKTFPCSF